MQTNHQNFPADYIEPLHINGLHGRILTLPARKKSYANKDILMLYGLHSSLERMYGIVENVADYGNVIMPDLPGFGGMESFYKIGQTASIDAMADYLATLVKLKFKYKKFSIVAMSYGFVVATRMLQKYPEIAKQVTLVISLAGLTNKNEFLVKKSTYRFWIITSTLLDGKFRSMLFRYTALQAFVIKTVYWLQSGTHPKMKSADKSELKKRRNFEVKLWQMNDVHTYMHVTKNILSLDLTSRGKKIPAQVLHIRIDSDQYIDHNVVKKNLKSLYESVDTAKAHMPNHAPTIISSAKDAAPFIPKKARLALARQAKAVK